MKLRHVLVLIGCALAGSCGNFTQTTIYNDKTYDQLNHEFNIRVKNVDGRISQFYRMEVVRTDDQYIYARCWETKGSAPVDYKFNKSEIIIENTKFSGSRTGEIVLSIGVLAVIVILIQLAVNRNR